MSSDSNNIPHASIVVVNYNSGPHLKKCLESVKAQTFEDFEVVVLDNASTDNSIELAKLAIGPDRRIRFQLESENHGFAKGNNRAIESARSRWIITLNPDAFPEPDWLEQLLVASDTHPEVVHFGSTQFNADDPERLDGAGDRYFAGGIPWRDRTSTRIDKARADGRNTFETFAACAAAAMYRADVLEAVRGFDERFFCFVEDVDLGFRLRLRGHKCLQVIDARVAHVGGGAGGGVSEFARYHGTRNLTWCFVKNMPGPLLPLLVPVHAAVLAVLLIKAAARGNAGPIYRAIRDAVMGLREAWRSRRHAAGARTSSVCDIAATLDWNPFSYFRGRS